MQLFYISRNYRASNNAASKPKKDCEIVFDNCGFKNLGFKQSSHPSSAVGAVVSFLGITKGLVLLPRKSVFVMQYPLSKFYGYVTNIVRFKKCKIILVIHDVKVLMGKSKDIAGEMKKFNKADVLVVHNEKMKQWFLDNDYKGELVCNYLFDYIKDIKNVKSGLLPKEKPHEVVFAGGLGNAKSEFLYKMDHFKERNYFLKLYGNGYNQNAINKESSIIDYQGVFTPEQVVNEIKGTFGLVWNGNSVEECLGDFGNYLRYNNPHKTSLYILCGLPIIVWKQAAIANFITKENLGFCIDSLEDIDEKLQGLSSEKYKTMVNNVAIAREKVANGTYLELALQDALKTL